MNKSRVCLVATVVSIGMVMVASQSWAAKSRASSGGRDAAVQKCIAQVQAQFGGPRNSPDEDARARVNLYKSCMTEAGYRP
jgi:hypothetical protein